MHNLSLNIMAGSVRDAYAKELSNYIKMAIQLDLVENV